MPSIYMHMGTLAHIYISTLHVVVVSSERNSSDSPEGMEPGGKLIAL